MLKIRSVMRRHSGLFDECRFPPHLLLEKRRRNIRSFDEFGVGATAKVTFLNRSAYRTVDANNRRTILFRRDKIECVCSSCSEPGKVGQDSLSAMPLEGSAKAGLSKRSYPLRGSGCENKKEYEYGCHERGPIASPSFGGGRAGPRFFRPLIEVSE